MGLVPSQTLVGDTIGVFIGVTVPFILRDASSIEETIIEIISEDQTFLLVGESYIHGLMDGEAFEPG